VCTLWYSQKRTGVLKNKIKVTPRSDWSRILSQACFWCEQLESLGQLRWSPDSWRFHCVRIVVCCSVLQCVAVCCSVLQMYCSVLVDDSTIRVLQRVAVCCLALQCSTVCCRVLQCFSAVLLCFSLPHTQRPDVFKTNKVLLDIEQFVTVCCSMLHGSAVRCSVCETWCRQKQYSAARYRAAAMHRRRNSDTVENLKIIPLSSQCYGQFLKISSCSEMNKKTNPLSSQLSSDFLKISIGQWADSWEMCTSFSIMRSTLLICGHLTSCCSLPACHRTYLSAPGADADDAKEPRDKLASSRVLCWSSQRFSNVSSTVIL